MKFSKKLIVGNVPEIVKNSTRYYMTRYHMNLYDSFNEACRKYAEKGTKLFDAWYSSDLREYIPSAYIAEYLDFAKYPLNY